MSHKDYKDNLQKHKNELRTRVCDINKRIALCKPTFLYHENIDLSSKAMVNIIYWLVLAAILGFKIMYCFNCVKFRSA